jgi:hypothetical protein
MEETGDGNFELALDSEGIEQLEDGLTELRYMHSGEASTPTDGVGEFRLKRVPDES